MVLRLSIAAHVGPMQHQMRMCAPLGCWRQEQLVGKTHVGMEVWYFKDKLDEERFDRARTAARVRHEEWASVCQEDCEDDVCLLRQLNGTSAWSEGDHEMVKHPLGQADLRRRQERRSWRQERWRYGRCS